LADLGFDSEISRKGVPAPIQVGKRWVVERTHSWMNGYAKLRRRTDKDGDIVEFSVQAAPRRGVGRCHPSSRRAIHRQWLSGLPRALPTVTVSPQ